MSVESAVEHLPVAKSRGQLNRELNEARAALRDAEKPDRDCMRVREIFDSEAEDLPQNETCLPELLRLQRIRKLALPDLNVARKRVRLAEEALSFYSMMSVDDD